MTNEIHNLWKRISLYNLADVSISMRIFGSSNEDAYTFLEDYLIGIENLMADDDHGDEILRSMRQIAFDTDVNHYLKQKDIERITRESKITKPEPDIVLMLRNYVVACALKSAYDIYEQRKKERDDGSGIIA